jgi:hypothetical protein
LKANKYISVDLIILNYKLEPKVCHETSFVLNPGASLLDSLSIILLLTKTKEELSTDLSRNIQFWIKLSTIVTPKAF